MSVSYKILEMEGRKKLTDGAEEVLALQECRYYEVSSQSDKTQGNLQRMKAQGKLRGGVSQERLKKMGYIYTME